MVDNYDVVQLRKSIDDLILMMEALTKEIEGVRALPEVTPTDLKWDYRWVLIKDDEYETAIDILDAAGQDRWEFTGFTTDTGGGREYLMKRCY